VLMVRRHPSLLTPPIAFAVATHAPPCTTKPSQQLRGLQP
jgi:hypothetical protein